MIHARCRLHPRTKGQSGNPTGRPKGIPDRRVALRALLDPYAEQIVAKVVRMALRGDPAALRICIDRLIPPIKAKDTPVGIGRLAGTLSEQGRAVIEKLGAGEITPEQAGTIMQVVSAQARIIEIDKLERRLKALEEKSNVLART